MTPAWRIQVCVKRMPRRKDNSSDLREVGFAAYLSHKGYEAIS